MASAAPPRPVTSGPPVPPPVIPTSYLAPHEQRWVVLSILGLVELQKTWDVFSPWIIVNPEPTWSSALRLSGLWTFLFWTASELFTLAAISMLRIPMISPSATQRAQCALCSAVFNGVLWFFAEPGSFAVSLSLGGPSALGGGLFFWTKWYTYSRWNKASHHLEGTHKIRLLPYSTATLNPLSLTYCIPPNSSNPLYIPIVFNNSLPYEVSYVLRSLDTGYADVRKAPGKSLKLPSGAHPKVKAVEDHEEEDEGPEPVQDPMSALILRGSNLDIEKLPSVKPLESLQLVPPSLARTQSVRFLRIDSPGVVSLRVVSDNRGDHFHIAPHKEAIVTECPTGGHFVDEDEHGRVKTKSEKSQPALLRCVGDTDVAQLSARGVGALRVGWKKSSRHQTETGVIEGIEEDIASVDDQLALVRTDKVSKTHTVPLRVNHEKPGIYTVSLTSVTDATHNSYNPSGYSAEKTYNVIARSSAHLDCGRSKELLVGGKVSVDIVVDGEISSSGPLQAIWSFVTTGGSSNSTIKLTKGRHTVSLREPGTVSLLDIQGPCSGSILEPSTCTIQLVPPPTLDMQVTTLHECAMDVGATVAFEFTGAPPFAVDYTEQRDRQRATRQSKRFATHHAEIVLQPDQEGQYIYTFVTLSDAKYTQVKLDRPPITQTVRPLASVDIVGRGDGIKRQKMYACSGDEIAVAVDAKGTTPLKLTYLKSWSGKSLNETVHISPGRSQVNLHLPEELQAVNGASGKFSVALLSIEDGNGCIKKLSALTYEVDINRERPTVRFVRSDRSVVVEGEVVRIGLRLTGEPPWEVGYAMDGGPEKQVTIRDPNSQLSFADKGVYRLTRVRDAHCSGTIFEADSIYEVDFKPRPSVQLMQSPSVSEGQGGFRHKGFCAGGADSVALRFSGQAPYELAYRYTAEGKTTRHSLKSAQETGILHLATEPGSHRYDFTELRDSNYVQTPITIALEHEVHGRPSAGFAKSLVSPLCLDQALVSDAKIFLQGRAPFKLGLAVGKPASVRTQEYEIDITGYDWKLDLPHTLTEIGRHEVTIFSLSDASGCMWEINDDDLLTTTVEVVESARIVSVAPQEDLCVGDTLDFLLQGKAPWTIEYHWLGKKHKVSSSASRFSRYAEEEGEFSVRSVALKNDQCKREVHDLVRHVHPLPSVRIQQGRHDLREGDGPAAFSVTFTGTPPFSFTYARSEQVGSRMKVVETQTITDIAEKSYTISSSSPGDYEVTSVSDRWCRYPPLARNEG